MAEVKIAVAGAAGRMGRANIAAILAAEGAKLVGAIERDASAELGQDAGRLAGGEKIGVTLTSNAEHALSDADVLIDFTKPDSSVALSKLAVAGGVAHIVGTTGCTEEDEAQFRAASEAIGVVRSNNFSLGVNLLASLVRKAAAALDDSFDIEVFEMHHNRKADAPSGTALMLGRAAARGRGVEFKSSAVLAREGITGPRHKGSIGFAALRGGNVIGDHTVMFVSDYERIELTHRAEDRGLFAAGALKAAFWIAGKPNGYYDMTDVLGLKD
ncbi:MAG: 4-hydroxy-tetrahydrodipicolinate reductase [Hyphomicrobiaceae bacterium]|nr:4-hydroxy-tetrahydrodipicolinate reductase [Hyphomicrobiaceae bacterium]